MSARKLFLAGQQAIDILNDFGLEGDERQLGVESETPIPELVTELLEAEEDDLARILGAKESIERTKRRIERFKARIEGRRFAIANIMDMVGIAKLSTGLGTISTKHVPASVIITEQHELPDGMTVVTTKSVPDMAKIKAALQAGDQVSGATLSNARKTIQIRR